MLADPAVQRRIHTLVQDAHLTLDAIRSLAGAESEDPLTDAKVLTEAVKRGIMDAPHLRNNPFARGDRKSVV